MSIIDGKQKYFEEQLTIHARSKQMGKKKKFTLPTKSSKHLLFGLSTTSLVVFVSIKNCFQLRSQSIVMLILTGMVGSKKSTADS